MGKQFSLRHFLLALALFWGATLCSSFHMDISLYPLFKGETIPQIDIRTKLLLSQLNLICASALLILFNPTNLNIRQRISVLLIAIILIICNLMIPSPYWSVWFFMALLFWCGGINFKSVSKEALGYLVIFGAAFFNLSFVSNTHTTDVQYDFPSCYNYIEYILENNFLFWHENPLLTRPSYSAYHPILHFFLAAIGIRIGTLLNFSKEVSSEAVQVLFVSYMLWYGLISARILNLFNLKKLPYLSLLAFIVFFPIYNAISGYFNNDCLLLPLQAGMIYYSLCYYQSGGKKNLFWIWLFTTAGALTKLSAILVLPMIAVVFLLRLLQKKDKQTFYEELICGMAILGGIAIWPLYQHFILHVSYDFVPPQTHLALAPYSMWERFNPLGAFIYERMFYNDFGNNLWETMTKTALFGQWDFSQRAHSIFWMIPVLVWLYKLIIAIVLLLSVYVAFIKHNHVFYWFIMALFAGLIIGQIIFGLKHPFMCNQDFRYVAILPLVMAMLMAQFMSKDNSRISYLICGILLIFAFFSDFIWHFVSC